MSDALDFIVNKSDLRTVAFVPGRHTADTPLGPGQIMVRIDRFAFTANNITYGVVGELIGYWTFFPADAGWGRIPVWGFADIHRSQHDDLHPGERLYGYFPMSTHLVLQPASVTAAGFVDAAPHRAALPPIYNQYTRVAADPTYDRAAEAQIALFRPLFTTAFLLDDFLAEHAWFGADTIILSSASSKTALGLAYLLSTTPHRAGAVVGLTSPANRTFVERTGCYDHVLTYDDLTALPTQAPAVFVDFAGAGGVVAAVHAGLGSQLRYSCVVGVTHWEERTPSTEIPGPAPALFFAPDQARKRMAEWGAAELQERTAAALRRFLASATGWLRIVEGHGPTAVESVYRALLDGHADPHDGHILSL